MLFRSADFDMFIVPISESNNDRGREVHLSQFTGTDKLSSRYFTEGFISSPQHPFKASNGMIWAYMVPETFKYPQEAVNITKAYPDFVKWYQSSGTTNDDWYNHGVSQYLY